jgi:GNAT superfamily N-acetyltransferase
VLFRSIESIEAAKQVFPLLRELRPHLGEGEFIDLWHAARATSAYRLIAGYEGPECVGLMGYRILYDFLHGKHLYVDDLVVASSHRSRGLGAQFLAEARRLAAEAGCARLRLCTGVDMAEARRFYERNGWEFKAVVYKIRV